MEGMTEGTKLEKKHLTKLEMKIAKEKMKIAKEKMKIDKERVKIAKEEVTKEKAPKKGKSKTEAERDQQEKKAVSNPC